MASRTTASREQWLAARLELLEAEKELTRRSDDVARQRQQLPWVPVEKDYRFETEAGATSLAYLFGGRSQLLVYHFMFGPEYKGGCPSCSAIADGFNGFAVHLEHHDVGMIAVSRAPIAALQAYKRRMGWTFTWASSLDSEFNLTSTVRSPRTSSARGPSTTTTARRTRRGSGRPAGRAALPSTPRWPAPTGPHTRASSPA